VRTACSWKGAALNDTVMGSKCEHCGHRDITHDEDGCVMCLLKATLGLAEECVDLLVQKGGFDK
jgi:hypothetical protein